MHTSLGSAPLGYQFSRAPTGEVSDTHTLLRPMPLRDGKPQAIPRQGLWGALAQGVTKLGADTAAGVEKGTGGA